MEERINVCYGISDRDGNYAKITGTSICSLLLNTSAKVIVHLLHDNTMTEKNRCYFEHLVTGHGAEICFHDVSRKWGQMWQGILEAAPALAESRLSIGTFFRLIMGDIITARRVIYLDSDIIVNMDIKELWERETAGSGLAAAPDQVLQKCPHNMTESGIISQKEYFNAGVLLIDLEKFRKVDDFLGRSLDFLAKYHPAYLDQDILNYFFPHSCVLPREFNSFVYIDRLEKNPVGNRLYHYVNNGLGLYMEDEFNALYFRYFTKTPWCNEFFIGNLAKKIDDAGSDMIQLANLCAGKRRLVIGMDSGRESISQFLMLRENEEYISYEALDEYEFSFSRSKDIFLIFLNDGEYERVRDVLAGAGLSEHTHFIDMLQLIGAKKNKMDDYHRFLSC